MPRPTRKTSKRTSGKAPGSRRSSTGSLEEALKAVGRAMKRVDARWYLFGAQAVALHGVPRTTQDIDVTVLVDSGTPALLEALRAEGITPRFDDDEFIAATRVIPADHLASGWKVDVVLGGPGLEEFIEAQALTRRVGRATVPLLRLEHLLTLKVLADRPRDLADVSRLLAVNRSTVKAPEVRELLRALEQALAEDGLVTRFDRLLAEARR